MIVWLKYWKPLAAAVILLAAFVWHKYAEHQAVTAAVANVQAKMAAAAGKQATEALQKELDQEAKLKKTVETFNARIARKDTFIAGLADRLHDYEVRGGTVPQAPGTTSGAGGTTEVDRGAEAVRRRTQEVFDAAREDAKRLGAIQEAWPK